MSSSSSTLIPPPAESRTASRPVLPGEPRVPRVQRFVVTESGLKETAIAFVVAMAIAFPILAWGGWAIYSIEAEKEATRLAWREKVESLDRLLAAPAGNVLPLAEASHGRDVFLSACASCHHADGTGMPKLGKDLVHSWFVASLDDSGLVEFLHQGRAANSPANTTKVAMPPKGGRDDLTDDDVRAIAVYLRGLQDPRRMPSLPDPVVLVAPTTEAEKAAALAAAGGDAELAGYIASGTKLYSMTCAACHGKDAKGLPKNGKDLVASEFCKKLNDDELLAYLKKGRDPSDPLNTTGVGMPPKGGNPALSDDDLLDIISYLRSLQTASSAK